MVYWLTGFHHHHFEVTVRRVSGPVGVGVSIGPWAGTDLRANCDDDGAGLGSLCWGAAEVSACFAEICILLYAELPSGWQKLWPKRDDGTRGSWPHGYRKTPKDGGPPLPMR